MTSSDGARRPTGSSDGARRSTGRSDGARRSTGRSDGARRSTGRSDARTRFALALVAGALVACNAPRVELALQVPAGSLPLADADQVTLTLTDGTGRVLGFTRAAASAGDLTLPDLPSGTGFTLTLDASFHGDVIARGRTCAFDVGATAPTRLTLYFSNVGSFAPVAAMPTARTGQVAFPLGTGAMIVGGSDGLMALSSSELFDPATATFQPGPMLDDPRAGAAATVLPSGTVLVFGGATPSATPADALTGGKFMPVPSTTLPADLTGAAAIDVGLGLALVAGGHATGAPPSTATWLVSNGGTVIDPGPTLLAARSHFTLTATTRSPDALAVVAGGLGASRPVAAIELFDPSTQSFSPGGADLTVPRYDHTATALGDGRILFAGGRRADGGVEASGEIYDAVTRTVRAAGSLRIGRARHSATLLPSGRVLITGGEDDNGNPISDAEIFDPTLGPSGDFVPTAPLASPRAGHDAVPLCDGTLLIVGGGAGAERYNPF